jgi:hypothetical protein
MAQNKYDEFKTILENAEADFVKFYDKGVAAAGARVRKACQELAVLAKEVRKDVTEVKNARKAEKE